MPHSIAIEAAHHLVVVRIEGTPTANQILEAYDELLRLEPTLNRLWDYRDADLCRLSSAELARVARYAARHEPDPGPSRVAVVVARDVDFGVGRAYQAWADEDPEEHRVFRELGDARRWLEQQ